MATRLEIQARIRVLREELENRYKTGLAKMADTDGKSVSTIALQNELYRLTYKLSKLD